MSILSQLELVVLLLILFIAILVWILPFEWAPFRLRRVLDQLPGPKAYPIIGNILSFMVPPEEIVGVLSNLRRRYGPVVRYWILGAPMVMVVDPEVIEAVLNDRQNTNKGKLNDYIKSWLGDGLLTTEGQHWFNHRRMLLPAFNVSILSGYLETFNENSRILVEKLRESEPEQLMVNLSMWALASLCKTSMGFTIDQTNTDGLRYTQNIRRMNEIFIYRYRSFWLTRDVLFRLSPQGREWTQVNNNLRSFTDKVINIRKAEVLNKKNEFKEIDEDLGIKKRKSFLDMLLEYTGEDRFSQRELQEEVDTFMFAGHDTTLVTTMWILYCLGLHPEEQEKVVQEIKEVLGDNHDRDPTMEDLRDMKYLDQVINESARLYPTVSGIFRRLSKDLSIKGYLLPAGTTVYVSALMTHRDEDIYPEPSIFNPDNFSPDALQSRHRCSFIPFGYGPRKCVGYRYASLKVKVGIIHLLKNFTVKSLEKPENIKLMLGMMTVPKESLNIILMPRST